MKYRQILSLAVCLLLIPLASASGANAREAQADAKTDVSAAPETKTAKPAPAPIYVPPRRKAPRSRTGGATRGAGPAVPAVEVLAPESVGLTLAAQPVLYWYIGEPANRRAELILVKETAAEPLLKADLGVPKRSGVQRVRLADHGVELETGVDYQWFVAIASKSDPDGHDHVAGGGVALVAVPADLAPKLAAANEAGRAHVLAAGGIWYDAVDALSQRIADAPDDTTPRLQRADLLAQVGLDEVARAERAAAGMEPRPAK
jgi:hypothetical protein